MKSSLSRFGKKTASFKKAAEINGYNSQQQNQINALKISIILKILSPKRIQSLVACSHCIYKRIQTTFNPLFYWWNRENIRQISRKIILETKINKHVHKWITNRKIFRSTQNTVFENMWSSFIVRSWSPKSNSKHIVRIFGIDVNILSASAMT